MQITENNQPLDFLLGADQSYNRCGQGYGPEYLLHHLQRRRLSPCHPDSASLFSATSTAKTISPTTLGDMMDNAGMQVLISTAISLVKNPMDAFFIPTRSSSGGISRPAVQRVCTPILYLFINDTDGLFLNS